MQHIKKKMTGAMNCLIIHYSCICVNLNFIIHILQLILCIIVCVSFCFQIAEALSYLHGAEQTLHNNVCPASILINKRGMWKLGGMSFSVKSRDGKVSRMRQFVFIFFCGYSSPFCGALVCYFLLRMTLHEF